jgi:hypothetical protein
VDLDVNTRFSEEHAVSMFGLVCYSEKFEFTHNPTRALLSIRKIDVDIK